MFIKNRIKTTKIIFLSTETGPEEDLTADDIDRQDRDRGCICIGCHYFIRRDGMVETGRPLDKMGHYKRKHNKDSVYVKVVGSRGNFTPEQIKSGEEIGEELLDLYPDAKIISKT